MLPKGSLSERILIDVLLLFAIVLAVLLTAGYIWLCYEVCFAMSRKEKRRRSERRRDFQISGIDPPSGASASDYTENSGTLTDRNTRLSFDGEAIEGDSEEEFAKKGSREAGEKADSEDNNEICGCAETEIVVEINRQMNEKAERNIKAEVHKEADRNNAGGDAQAEEKDKGETDRADDKGAYIKSGGDVVKETDEMADIEASETARKATDEYVMPGKDTDTKTAEVKANEKDVIQKDNQVNAAAGREVGKDTDAQAGNGKVIEKKTGEEANYHVGIETDVKICDE